MIPNISSIVDTTLNIEEQPSKNHRMFLSDEKINGYSDELVAMEQVIFKILNTERYTYKIYSWNYGIELEDLFGEATSYVCVELKRRITEALRQDDRILDVDEFEFDTSRRGIVSAYFTVKTKFGDLNEGLVVKY